MNYIGFLHGPGLLSAQEWGEQWFHARTARHPKLETKWGTRWLVIPALHTLRWRSPVGKSPVSLQVTSWEPGIMLALGHRKALSSWRLITNFLPPGLESKINSCIRKLIWLLKTEEWKINGGVRFSPLLEFFHVLQGAPLPHRLWPERMVTAGQKGGQGVSTGGPACTCTGLL